MSRTIPWVALAGIATLLGGCWEPDYCDPERIVFEDANLEEEVRRDLSIPWADITQEDLDRLQALSASSASIRSLRGLECATSLQDIQLNDNPLDDLTPLTELPALAQLSLSRVEVSSWEPLRGQNGLIALDVSGSSFGDADLPIVLGMPQLSSLRVSNTEITSLAPLGAHGGIEVLAAAGNDLTDYRIGLSTVTTLRELDLASNRLLGTEAGALPPNLEILRLNGNTLASTELVDGLNQVHTLDLSGNVALQTVAHLSGLSRLTLLDLTATRVADLGPLTALTELFELDLTGVDFDCHAQSDNVQALRTTIVETNRGTFTMHCTQDCAGTWGGTAVEDLCGICDADPENDHRLVDPALRAHITAVTGLAEPTFGAVSGITTLDMESLGIENIYGLECFVALEQLSLFDNRIADLSPVSGLDHLEYLNLGSNRVSDLRDLSSLASLQRLDLGNNAIEQLLPLQALTALTWLDLSQNQIQDLTSLASLVALRDLDLGGNLIQDVSPLRDLLGLENLDLGQNAIVNVEPISVLTALLGFEAQSNAIVDPSPLLLNMMLVWLDLSNNPFDCEEPTTRTTLRDLGEMVVLHNDGTISHDCL